MKPNYLFILFLVISGCGAVPIPNEKVFQQTKLNGMSLESPSNPVDSFAFTPMQKMHINSVAVIPYAFSRKGEPEVYFNHDRQWWGERIDGAAELVDIAHSHNQKVMVKPHVWIHNDWIGTYQLETEEQWID